MAYKLGTGSKLFTLNTDRLQPRVIYINPVATCKFFFSVNCTRSGASLFLLCGLYTVPDSCHGQSVPGAEDAVVGLVELLADVPHSVREQQPLKKK